MSKKKELYVDVILPLDQPPFTYRVDDHLRHTISRGDCVVAQVATKLYTAIVVRLHNDTPPFKTIRTVESYVPNAPRMSDEQLRLWEWLSEYYMCNIGNIMRVGLPSALKPDGFTTEEFYKLAYKTPTVTYVSLHKSINSERLLTEHLDTLDKRAKRQYQTLMEFVEKVGQQRLFEGELMRSELSASMAMLRALEQKQILTIKQRKLKDGELPPLPAKMPKLTPAQQQAHSSIKEQFQKHDVVLIQGVTGSGKTEIYIKLMEEELHKGMSVLYLLPEIAMTAQLIERVESYFGERVITYHSRYTMGKRVENYLRINRSQGGELIMGTRSSLFLPTRNLGLIVVDEEHDTSYKSDTSPLYNARDAVIMLGQIMGAKTLLGSATPSLESYANAQSGKYGYTTLRERYGATPLPQIIISDTLTAVKRGERKSHFNKILLTKMEQTLERGEQIMLFQNRRGFSPYVECDKCGWIPFCGNCNVALTMHKGTDRLRCHYCGDSRAIPKVCDKCGEGSLLPQGFGTEKVEEELTLRLPTARIARLDGDTSRTVKQYNTIISNFESGKTDILVGTQMITKGFDFEGVSLVGVLNADNLLAYPDFRAAERAFQLLSQVIGRAGRRERQGEAVIQTSQPNNATIQQVATYDYELMAERQLSERSIYLYPPYCRMVGITMRHRDLALLWRAANWLGAALRPVFGRRLLGPQPPPIDKIKREYILLFTLKIERERSFAQAKGILEQSIKELLAQSDFRYVGVICDVDPQ